MEVVKTKIKLYMLGTDQMSEDDAVKMLQIVKIYEKEGTLRHEIQTMEKNKQHLCGVLF